MNHSFIPTVKHSTEIKSVENSGHYRNHRNAKSRSVGISGSLSPEYALKGECAWNHRSVLQDHLVRLWQRKFPASFVSSP